MSNDLLGNAVRIMMIRDLHALEREIEAYPDDDSLWLTPPGITNSAGNLALHLVGGLRHFIGATLGQTGYMRNRDAEFSAKGMSRDHVVAEIRKAISDVDRTLSDLDSSRIGSTFPIKVGPQPRSVLTSDWLVHLGSHLTYHLGQIDYHRRLVNADPSTVDTVSPKDIPEPKE